MGTNHPLLRKKQQHHQQIQAIFTCEPLLTLFLVFLKTKLCSYYVLYRILSNAIILAILPRKKPLSKKNQEPCIIYVAYVHIIIYVVFYLYIFFFLFWSALLNSLSGLPTQHYYCEGGEGRKSEKAII